jgi:hypothetical protein
MDGLKKWRVERAPKKEKARGRRRDEISLHREIYRVADLLYPVLYLIDCPKRFRDIPFALSRVDTAEGWEGEGEGSPLRGLLHAKHARR